MTKEIAIKEPMRLTSENVEAIFRDCLTDNSSFIVQGVVLGASFDRTKVEAYEEEIIQMLMQLPTQFHKHGGAGWSFQNMCIDNNGKQWTDLYQTMDKLVCLGIAIRAVEFVFERNLWKALLFCMPYIVINENYKQQ